MFQQENVGVLRYHTVHGKYGHFSAILRYIGKYYFLQIPAASAAYLQIFVQVLLNELKKSGCKDTDLLWRHPTPKKFLKENDAAFVDRGQKNSVWHSKYGTQLMKRINDSIKNRLGETLSQEYTTDLVRKSILQLYNNFGYSDM